MKGGERKMEVSGVNMAIPEQVVYEGSAEQTTEQPQGAFMEILSKQPQGAFMEILSKQLTDVEEKQEEEVDVESELLKMGAVFVEPIPMNWMQELQTELPVQEEVLQAVETLQSDNVSSVLMAQSDNISGVTTTQILTETPVLSEQAVINTQASKEQITDKLKLDNQQNIVRQVTSEKNDSKIPVITIESTKASEEKPTLLNKGVELEYTQKQDILKQVESVASKVQKEDTALDVEELQNYVDEQSFQHFSTRFVDKVAQKTQEVVTNSVVEQVQEGIRHGITEKLETFTIRLRPEGLGEILVHMETVGDKIAMSIGVSKLETQQILNQELQQLKEVLKPFQAEIKEVYQSQPDAFQMMDQQQQQQAFYRQREAFYASNQKHQIQPDEELLEQLEQLNETMNMQGWRTYV